MVSSGEQGGRKPHSWRVSIVSLSSQPTENEVLFCRLPDSLTMASFLSAADVNAKLDVGCRVSQWQRTLYSLRTATVFKQMRHWACPKCSVKKYFIHSGLKAQHLRSTFLLTIADMMIFRGASVVKILVMQICPALPTAIT